MRVVSAEEFAKLPNGVLFNQDTDGEWHPLQFLTKHYETNAYRAFDLEPISGDDPKVIDLSDKADHKSHYFDDSKFNVYEKSDIQALIDVLQAALRVAP